MLGPRLVINRKSRDEGEKPFWISYADLMTALMALFLVTMAVALIHAQQKLNKIEGKEEERLKKEEERKKDIERFWKKIEAIKDPAIKIDRDRSVVDFGEKARFGINEDSLPKTATIFLREEVFKIVKEVKTVPEGRWVKRILVEGYTDYRGSYLYNLNLSLNRAKRIICTLLEPGDMPDEKAEPGKMKDLIRDLFFIGGFSFNNPRASDEASRRVELKLEFRGVGEAESIYNPNEVIRALDALLEPPGNNDFGECDKFWFVKNQKEAHRVLF